MAGRALLLGGLAAGALHRLGCDRAAQRLYQEQQEARRTIMTSTTWNGTHLEQLDLLAAISRHCACQVGFDGVCVAVCPPHRMLVEDQRALDGLLFARRLARCLESEERRAA